MRNRNKGYFLVGIMLMIAFFVQYALHLEWEWLEELQRVESYKRWSGVFLAAYVLSQWRLSILRARFITKSAIRNCAMHKKAGALAPVFFYVHSTTLGHAYLFMLSTVYFANVALGLFNVEILRLKSKQFSYGWMIVHVALSVIIVILIAYHVFVAIAYK